MERNKIKKEYNEKIKKLVQLNKYYYDLSKPLVNDREYDQIKLEILSLESLKVDSVEESYKIFTTSLALRPYCSITYGT